MNSEVSPEQSSERILLPGASYLCGEGETIHLLRGPFIQVVLFETQPAICLSNLKFYILAQTTHWQGIGSPFTVRGLGHGNIACDFKR